MAIENWKSLDPLGEAKELLDNFLCFTMAPTPEEYQVATGVPQIIQAMASVSIAESLNSMSNELASLCDLLTDMLQSQEAERNRRDLEIG